MKLSDKRICQKEDLLAELANKNLEVLMTMGAGDIDTFIEPIKKQLTK